MRPSDKHVAAVEAWLRAHFSGAYVASDHIFDREVQLFRARAKPSPVPAVEIEITDEACEDHTIAEVIQALEEQRTAEILAREPGSRLVLDRALVVGQSAHDPRH